MQRRLEAEVAALRQLWEQRRAGRPDGLPVPLGEEWWTLRGEHLRLRAGHQPRPGLPRLSGRGRPHLVEVPVCRIPWRGGLPVSNADRRRPLRPVGPTVLPRLRVRASMGSAHSRRPPDLELLLRRLLRLPDLPAIGIQTRGPGRRRHCASSPWEPYFRRCHPMRFVPRRCP